MSHNIHQRKLAAPPMDPPSGHRHLHPQPDPAVIQPFTIQNISHRFSKLYTNHKKHLPEEKKHLSCTTLTKSSSQHDRKVRGKNPSSKKEESLEEFGDGVGRRRSFCSSEVELSDFLCCNGVKVVAADMPPFMQIHAVGCARKTHDSLEKFTSKTLAFILKKEFDGAYGPAWHCIVGTSFGSFVTHSVGGFLYFSMDQKLYILLFKTTVQRAH